MAEDKTIALVKRLHSRTVAGLVPWERTLADGVYQAGFKGYSIKISERPGSSPDALDAPDYAISIYDDAGELVDEFTDVELSNLPGQREDRRQLYSLMRTTFVTARRIAMGVEKALDALLSELHNPDDDIPF